MESNVKGDIVVSLNRLKRQRSLNDYEDDRVVGYVCDTTLLEETTKIPLIGHRAKLVDALIKSYNLLSYMKIYTSIPASEEELSSFHSSDYIGYLKTINDIADPEDDQELEFGLGYDCPLVDDIFKFVCHIAGGTLTAAKALVNKEVDVVINWCGGWHHAQRDEAEGFCYINDIVLGIEELRKVYNFVLYIDLDIHHGNGVQNAFAFTNKVLTLSFHKYEPGFYPGTGSVDDIGLGKGKYYTVNVPLSEGLSDRKFSPLFERITNKVLYCYKPDAIVVQCGADCLTGDKVGDFNLTPIALGKCVRTILNWKKPTLFLGGGGYNITNTARCWTYLTSIICNVDITFDIPDNEYYTEFGPDYELEVTASYRVDTNLDSTLDVLTSTVTKNLEFISS